jgi:cell division protein FtsQ
LTDIGDTIPLSSKFTSRVLVVQGNISSNEIANILKLCKFIEGDEFWKASVEQVLIGSNADYEIYTKLGNQNVVIGKIDEDLENKFKKLKAIYTEVLPKVGFEQYKTINLKYKGQVVCSKIYTLKHN